MEMTFKLHIPNRDLLSYVQDELKTYFEELGDWKDLQLTKQEEGNIVVDAARLIEGSIQCIINDWMDTVDTESFAFALVDGNPVLSDRLSSLRKQQETEEQKRDLEERIASAAKFLQKHGHTVKRKG
jgi:hypothetical protein